MRSAGPRLLALLPALLLLAACNGERSAVQLVLTPNPELSSAREILDQVDTLLVLADSPAGLAGVSTPGPVEGGGTAVDIDGDGALEVLFGALPLVGAELPVLEIGLGDNVGRDLWFQVFGLPAGVAAEPARAIAVGGVAVLCPRGEVRKLGMPFNLRAAARPPRVVLVLPQDGAFDVPRELGAATVVLSTVVDPNSTAGGARVLRDGGVAMPMRISVATASFPGQPEGEQRSVMTLAFPSRLDPGYTYAIEVGPGIVSLAGRSFDQVPSTAAGELFRSTFTIAADYPTPLGCDDCPKGYTCGEDFSSCVPVLDCSGGCQAGFVCDPATQACREDCRLFGACPAPGEVCDSQSGLCASAR